MVAASGGHTVIHAAHNGHAAGGRGQVALTAEDARLFDVMLTGAAAIGDPEKDPDGFDDFHSLVSVARAENPVVK